MTWISTLLRATKKCQASVQNKVTAREIEHCEMRKIIRNKICLEIKKIVSTICKIKEVLDSNKIPAYIQI